MESIRVLIADDHTLFRDGLRALLASISDIEVVGETGDGREAVELVRVQAPNIVLMDIAMPGLNGLDATARVVSEAPHTRVIILSMHADEEYVRQALRAGASGYLLKNAAPEELELAIQAVMRGEIWLSSVISRVVVENYLDPRGDDAGPLAQLTPRQREILDFITRFSQEHDYSPSYREIAEHFHLSSTATIAEHIETLKTKGYLRDDLSGVRALQLEAVERRAPEPSR